MAASSTQSKLFWLSCAAVSLVIARSFAQNINKWAEARRTLARFSEESQQKPRDANTVAHAETDAKKQGTEEDLSVATLEILSRHPNYDIRQAARKIAIHRFAHNNECITRLRHNLHDTTNRREAIDVLRSLASEVEPSALLGDEIAATDPHDFDTLLDEFLNNDRSRRLPCPNRLSRQARPLERQGPMLTLEEVEGVNGEIVSVRLPALSAEGLGLEGDNQSGAEQELRRWQRREAMVVQFNNDESDEEIEGVVVVEEPDTNSEDREGRE